MSPLAIWIDNLFEVITFLPTSDNKKATNSQLSELGFKN